MATITDNDLASDDAAGTSLASPAVSVTSGDLVVVAFKYEGTEDTSISCSDGSAYSKVTDGYHTPGGDLGLVMFYRVVSSTGTVTPTVTSASRSWRQVMVWVFTPAATTTLSLDTNTTPAFQTNVTAVSAGSASAAAAGASVTAFAIYSAAGLTVGSGWSEASTHDVTGVTLLGEYRLQTGSGSLTGDGTISTSTNAVSIMAIFKETATSTIDQEGFAFGDDDGSESAHTLGTQDTNYSGALGTKTLRALLNTTSDDPASTAYTLYSAYNAGAYAAVPTASATSPTLSWGAAGTIAYSTAGGASVAPTYPTGITTNSALVLIVGQKPTTANGGTVTTPSGWTLQASRTGANDGDTGGYTTTLGVDTGNMNIFVYTKDTVSGSESGTLSVTVGDNNVAWANIYRVQASDTCTWSYDADDGKDTSAGSVSIATTNGIAITAGDFVIGAMAIPTDVTTPAQFSAQAFTQTSTTFGTAVEIEEPDSTTGNDIGGFSCYAEVSSGGASGAVTMTATAGGTTTNVRGPGIVLRLRAASVNNKVYVSTSSNVTAGGEATTARLTAPAGGNSFLTGRRWDDENGSDSIDLGTTNYTEVEWVLTTQSPATNTDTFDFRVYAGASALATYGVTPRWTISGGGSTELPPLTMAPMRPGGWGRW